MPGQAYLQDTGSLRLATWRTCGSGCARARHQLGRDG